MPDKLTFLAANVVLYLGNSRAIRGYWRAYKRLPDVANPTDYAERMLWRKTVDHNPRHVLLTDKLAAKAYCRCVCPEMPIARTLWEGYDADAIPDDILRGDVIVKTNHSCDCNYFIHGSHVDRVDLKRKTDRWMRTTYGVRTAEWAYSQIRPKLFVEESVGDRRRDLLELNIRASNGRPILGSVIGHCKLPDHWIVYLDNDGRPIAGLDQEEGEPPPTLPDGLSIEGPYRRALTYARKLSAGIDFARFDFMWNGETLYGGEITFYPLAGVRDIINPAVKAAVLQGWDMEVSHFLSTPQHGLRRYYAEALRRQIQNAKRSADDIPASTCAKTIPSHDHQHAQASSSSAIDSGVDTKA